MESLPVEIYDMIMDHLDDQRAFFSLAYTSRRIHALSKKWTLSQYNQSENQALAAFVDRLIKRPDHAQQVKVLNLRRWHNGPWCTRSYRATLKQPSQQSVVSFLQAAHRGGLLTSFNESFDSLEPEQFENCSGFLQHDPDLPALDHTEVAEAHREAYFDIAFKFAIRQGFDDALTILLLALCPNLEHLSMRGISHSHLSFHFLQRVQNQGVSKLRTCDLWYGLSEGGDDIPIRRTLGHRSTDGLSLSAYEPLTCGTQLRGLQLVTLCSGPERDYTFESLCLSRNLTDLRLHVCHISDDELGGLLDGCDQLKKFRFTLTIRDSCRQYRRGPVITGQGIIHALAKHKNCLNVLDIDLSEDDHVEHHPILGLNFMQKRPICPLLGFLKLSSLYIDSVTLVGFAYPRKIRCIFARSWNTKQRSTPRRLPNDQGYV